MHTSQNVVKQRIMQRVYFIYTLRRLATPFVAKVATLSSLIVLASVFVSVPHVLQNMPSFLEITKFFNFLVSAFINTRVAIQAIALGALLVMFYLTRDVIRLINESRAFILSR